MPKIFVKPALFGDGAPLLVRDPRTRIPIPADGALVELDQLTRRRLRDGDLIEAKPAHKSTPKPAPAPAEKG